MRVSIGESSSGMGAVSGLVVVHPNRSKMTKPERQENVLFIRTLVGYLPTASKILTEFNQISVVVENVEILDPKSL
jgi:hypothetical protein